MEIAEFACDGDRFVVDSHTGKIVGGCDIPCSQCLIGGHKYRSRTYSGRIRVWVEMDYF